MDHVFCVVGQCHPKGIMSVAPAVRVSDETVSIVENKLAFCRCTRLLFVQERRGRGHSDRPVFMNTNYGSRPNVKT